MSMNPYELYGGPGDGAVMALAPLTAGRVYLLVFADPAREGWGLVHAYGVTERKTAGGVDVLEHELMVGRQALAGGGAE